MALVGTQPHYGDLIEIFRESDIHEYQHWAVYVGNGYVVHLAAPYKVPRDAVSSSLFIMTNRALVKKELLSEVVGTDKYRVNNKHDDRYPPRSPNSIIQRAEELVGTVIPFSVTHDNCEHFVNELRYGVSRSDQVTDAFTYHGILFAIAEFFLGTLNRLSQ